MKVCELAQFLPCICIYFNISFLLWKRLVWRPRLGSIFSLQPVSRPVSQDFGILWLLIRYLLANLGILSPRQENQSLANFISKSRLILDSRG